MKKLLTLVAAAGLILPQMQFTKVTQKKRLSVITSHGNFTVMQPAKT